MYHAPKPEGIENRKAYVVGGGIAGLSTAAFPGWTQSQQATGTAWRS